MDDLIRRQSAIEILGKHCNMDYGKVCGKDCECVEYMALRDTPSAQKKGHWIDEETVYEADECSCSECGQTVTTHKGERMNFCPNCGADMREDM